MFTSKTFTLLIAAGAASLAAASPYPPNGPNHPGHPDHPHHGYPNHTLPYPRSEKAASADIWAMFCDDTDCSQNCGISVKVSDPGCLNQNARQSVLFHGADTGSGDYSLVVSPSGDCPCQETCTSVPNDIVCWDISQYSDAQSFRFIGGHCDSDNC